LFFSTGNGSSLHPFQAEITALLQNHQPEIELGAEKLEMNDSYVWVDTEMQLKELVDVLSKEKFFGVDTEQHSSRSFLGFTGLVQVISCYLLYFFDCIMPITYF
jgi:cobalt/nickel-transporting P-type ATPase D